MATQRYHSIAEGAQHCADSFDRCMQLLNGAGSREIAVMRNQRGRFAMWASNLGVFLRGRRSIDFRLAGAQDFHRLVRGLLAVLQDNIDRCASEIIALAAEARNEAKNKAKNANLDDQCVTAESGSSGRLESYEHAIESCASDIRLLHQLSNAIRRAGRQSQNTKAERSFQIVDDQDRNIEADLERAFSRNLADQFPGCDPRIRERLASAMVARRKRIMYRRQRRAGSTSRRTEPAANSVEGDQLARPIIPVFHDVPLGEESEPTTQGAGKNISFVETSVTPSQVQTTTTLDHAKLQAPRPSAPSVAAPKTIPLTKHEKLVWPPPPRAAILDRFRRQKRQRRDEHKSRLCELPNYNILAEHTGPGRPPLAPNDLILLQASILELKNQLHRETKTDWLSYNDAEMEVTCPYCLEALSSTAMKQDSKWIEHLKTDLDPYVCLFTECGMASELFTHSDSWILHMRNHAMRWVCEAGPHDRRIFDQRDSYERHMQDEHEESFTPAQLSVLADANARLLGPLFDACPLCGMTRQDPQLKGTLEDHIAGHLRFLALKSLPFIPEEQMDTNSSRSANSASSGGGADRHTLQELGNDKAELIFHDGDSLPTSVEGADSEDADPFAHWGGIAAYVAAETRTGATLLGALVNIGDHHMVDNVDVPQRVLEKLSSIIPPYIRNWAQLKSWAARNFISPCAPPSLPHAQIVQVRQMLSHRTAEMDNASQHSEVVSKSPFLIPGYAEEFLIYDAEDGAVITGAKAEIYEHFCPECCIHFSTPQKLEEHQLAPHEAECPECGRTFTEWRLLAVHRSTHGQSGRFVVTSDTARSRGPETWNSQWDWIGSSSPSPWEPLEDPVLESFRRRAREDSQKTDQVPSLSAAMKSTASEILLATANLNIDFSLLKMEVPTEFQGIRGALSSKAREAAETGLPHATARRLGSLFEACLDPPSPLLLKAYGIRASAIVARNHAPGGGGGADAAASVWASATSGSAAIVLHLLACMLARLWDAREAAAIWVELVSVRKQRLRAEIAALDAEGHMSSVRAAVAANLEITRQQLWDWDANTRAWLRSADTTQERQKTQFSLIVQNVVGYLPTSTGMTYDNVLTNFNAARLVMERAIGGMPQRIINHSVFAAISSWHLYPDMAVVGTTANYVYLGDVLLPSAGILTLGMNTDSECWSLPLQHARSLIYRSPELPRDSTMDKNSSFCFGDLLYIAFGVVLRSCGFADMEVGRAAAIIVLLHQQLPSAHEEPQGTASGEQSSSHWLAMLSSVARSLAKDAEPLEPPRRDPGDLLKLVRLGLHSGRAQTAFGSAAEPMDAIFGLSARSTFLSLLRAGSSLHSRGQPDDQSLDNESTSLSASKVHTALETGALDPQALSAFLLGERGCLSTVAHLKDSLNALAFASDVFQYMYHQKISSRVLEQHLYDCPWMPRYGGLQGGSTGLYRVRALGCILHMAMGAPDISLADLSNVFAVSGNGYIYTTEAILSDPFTRPEQARPKILCIPVRTHHLGIMLWVSQLEPTLKAISPDSWRVVNFERFDGEMQDNFANTSIHMSFTDWVTPYQSENPTDRTAGGVLLMEGLMQVWDQGNWVADLDIVESLVKCRRISPNSLCQHRDDERRLHFPDGLVSIDNWEELLDTGYAGGTRIVRAFGNWQARLAAAAVSIQQGFETVILPPSQPPCWTCITPMLPVSTSRRVTIIC